MVSIKYFACAIFIGYVAKAVYGGEATLADDLTVLIDYKKYLELQGNQSHRVQRQIPFGAPQPPPIIVQGPPNHHPPPNHHHHSSQFQGPQCFDILEVYHQCGKRCVVSCRYAAASAAISIGKHDCDKDECVEGCFCKDGLVRHEGKCISALECPVRNCHRRDEIYMCGPASPITCDNALRGKEVADLTHRVQCVWGCYCSSGYLRNNNNGRCVPEAECRSANKIVGIAPHAPGLVKKFDNYGHVGSGGGSAYVHGGGYGHVPNYGHNGVEQHIHLHHVRNTPSQVVPGNPVSPVNPNPSSLNSNSLNCNGMGNCNGANNGGGNNLMGDVTRFEAPFDVANNNAGNLVDAVNAANVNSINPSSLTAPTNVANQVNPVNSVNQVNPASPANPGNSGNQLSASTSVNQVNPVNVFNQVNPDNSVNVVNPLNPANPVNLANTVSQISPVIFNQVNSGNPTNPVNAMNSANSANPVKPVSPGNPTNTINPVIPANPVNTISPAPTIISQSNSVSPSNLMNPTNFDNPANAVNQANPINTLNQVSPSSQQTPQTQQSPNTNPTNQNPSILTDVSLNNLVLTPLSSYDPNNFYLNLPTIGHLNGNLQDVSFSADSHGSPVSYITIPGPNGPQQIPISQTGICSGSNNCNQPQT